MLWEIPDFMFELRKFILYSKLSLIIIIVKADSHEEGGTKNRILEIKHLLQASYYR